MGGDDAAQHLTNAQGTGRSWLFALHYSTDRNGISRSIIFFLDVSEKLDAERLLILLKHPQSTHSAVLAMPTPGASIFIRRGFLPSLPFPYLPLFPLPSSLPFPPLPSSSCPSISLSPPCPHDPIRESGERCKLLQRARVQPGRQMIFGEFRA